MGNLSSTDATLLLGYLAASVAFGLWMGRRPRGMADFVVGGRDLPWWAVLLSIVATETSTVTFLSVPGVAFTGDLTFLVLGLGYIVGRIAIVGLLLPQFFRGETFTVYEVLGRHFGDRVRRSTSVLFLVSRNVADGLRLFLTALVLQTLFGWDLVVSVLAVGVLTIVYTVAGGMKAVVWMDCVQFVVYIAGALLAGWVIVDKLDGSAADLWESARAAGKLHWLDLRVDFTSSSFFGAGLIGGAFLTLATHGADQLMVQRYLCARGPRPAAVALIGSGLVVTVQFALFLAIGVALWAFYAAHPAAAPLGKDAVFADFIVHHLDRPAGAVGLLLGAVFSAAMSTLSSSLNSSAASAVHDLAPRRDRARDEAAALRRTRWLTVGFGVVQMAVAIGAARESTSVVNEVLGIAALTTGVTLGLMFLARFGGGVSATVALWALWIGLAGMLAVKLTTPLAWQWYAPLGSLGTLALGLLLAMLGGRRGSGAPTAVDAGGTGIVP